MCSWRKHLQRLALQVLGNGGATVLHVPLTVRRDRAIARGALAGE